jgi:hypothetical protein
MQLSVKKTLWMECYKMDAITLLKEFAQSKGISEKEVLEFLSKYDNPQTIEDLLKLPHDMLNHEPYISYLEEPLKDFIKEHIAYDRYETIDLEQVIDRINDIKYDLEEDEDEKDNEEMLETLKEVEKQIISSKFGSVVYDW